MHGMADVFRVCHVSMGDPNVCARLNIHAYVCFLLYVFCEYVSACVNVCVCERDRVCVCVYVYSTQQVMSDFFSVHMYVTSGHSREIMEF